jgi:hypothetical protein
VELRSKTATRVVLDAREQIPGQGWGSATITIHRAWGTSPGGDSRRVWKIEVSTYDPSDPERYLPVIYTDERLHDVDAIRQARSIIANHRAYYSAPENCQLSLFEAN